MCWEMPHTTVFGAEPEISHPSFNFVDFLAESRVLFKTRQYWVQSSMPHGGWLKTTPEDMCWRTASHRAT